MFKKIAILARLGFTSKLAAGSKLVWYVVAAGILLVTLSALAALWNWSTQPTEFAPGRLGATSASREPSCSSVPGSTAPLAASSAENEQAYTEAVNRYRDGKMSDAYGLFITLAEEGDPDAARIALFMHRYGAVLYGSPWDADPGDLGYWADVAKSPSTRPASVLPIAPVSTLSAQAFHEHSVRSTDLSNVR